MSNLYILYSNSLSYLDLQISSPILSPTVHGIPFWTDILNFDIIKLIHFFSFWVCAFEVLYKEFRSQRRSQRYPLIFSSINCSVLLFTLRSFVIWSVHFHSVSGRNPPLSFSIYWAGLICFIDVRSLTTYAHGLTWTCLFYSMVYWSVFVQKNLLVLLRLAFYTALQCAAPRSWKVDLILLIHINFRMSISSSWKIHLESLLGFHCIYKLIHKELTPV